MKAKITSLIVLLLLSINVKGQYQLEWVRSIDDTVSSYSEAEGMILDSSGNIYIDGFLDTLSTVKSFLISYDSSGTERFKTVPDYLELAFTWRLFNTSNNTFISAGHYEDQSGTNNMFYTEFNTNGDSITGGIFNSLGFATPDDFSDACVDGQGNLYMAGLMRNGNDMVAGVCRYDSGGNFRWSSTFPNLPGWDVGFVRAAELSGETGIYLWTFNYTGVGSLLYYDSAGVFKWQTELPLQINEWHAALVVDKDGNAITGGSMNNKFALAKTDITGDTIWTLQFADPFNANTTGDITNVLTDTSGNIFVLGSGNAKGIMAKVSSSGQLLWSDTIAGGGLLNKNRENFYLHNNVLTCVNSNFYTLLYQYDVAGNRITYMPLLIPGMSYPEVSDIIFSGQNLYLCGLQRYGSTRTGYVAKFNSIINSIHQVEKNKYFLYPNPVNDYLFVNENIKNEYKIFNIHGQLIQQMKSYGNMIDVRSLPAGVYYIELSDGFDNVSKFVKY